MGPQQKGEKLVQTASLLAPQSAPDPQQNTLKQEAKLLPRAVDGAAEAEWIIADYLDVVLHVFTPETREHYRLEDLWNDVPKLEAAATATA